MGLYSHASGVNHLPVKGESSQWTWRPFNHQPWGWQIPLRVSENLSPTACQGLVTKFITLIHLFFPSPVTTISTPSSVLDSGTDPTVSEVAANVTRENHRSFC